MLKGLGLCAALFAAPICTAAQVDVYPQRPIRLIVPFSAGGAGDIIARLVSTKLTEGLGQQIVVDTRAGGGSVPGTELTARALPDGYTLVLVATAHALNPGLLGKLPFDPIADFSPITLAVESPLIFVVPASLAVTNLRELIALAQSQPKRVTYGSAGQGTSGHLATELLSFRAGISLLHVPYKGASQALNDLLGAQIQLVCTSTLPALPHVRAGKLRGLAVTTPKRSRAAPDIPTVAEAAALPGFSATTWYALLAPAHTPPAIVTRLHRTMSEALRSPPVAESLLAQGAEPVASTPDEARKFLQTQIEVWTRVIKQANIKPDA